MSEEEETNTLPPLKEEEAHVTFDNAAATAAAPPALDSATDDSYTPAVPPDTPQRSTGDDVSSTTSQLTEASMVSRASASIASVFSQSLQILRGELPEEDTTTRDDMMQVGKSISFGQIPVEQSESEETPSEHEPVIDFLQDDHHEMTYSRRIALRLMNKSWYNPRAVDAGSDDEDEKELLPATSIATRPSFQAADNRHEPHVTCKEFPSIATAWAYFEHVTLPRFVFREKPPAPKKNLLHRAVRKMMKANKQLNRAEPGENHLQTKLYSPIFTPLKQMGDFGLGIGLYFSTLRAITLLTLLAGLINIPNLMYYSSQNYSDGQGGVPTLIRGSAICTRQVWVPCPDCNSTDFQADRFASVDNGSGTLLNFVLHNDCDGATLQQGFVNYGTLIFIMLGVLLMNHYQKHMEIQYDEDEQTAQDYSIVISNPPPDATDPQEWHDYFYENFEGAHATTCTVAVDNDFLVQTLLERRECLRKIEMLVEPGTSMDVLNIARMAAEQEAARNFFGRMVAMVLPGIPELFGRVTVLTARVQGLAQRDYPARNVFLSFETEAAQRRVLSALSVGSHAAKHNKTKVFSKNPHYLFRGQHVLLCKEADEPSTIRWQDLNAKFPKKLKSVLTTTCFTLAAIVGIAFLIRLLHDLKAAWAALAIAGFNTIFPEVAKLLTAMEAHATEGGKQTSLYFKIALFRWVNTAIIMTIVTPFTQTLDNNPGLIRSIYAIFFAEIVTTNGIQLLDPAGHFKRHFLAPRAATQDAMNLCFQGQVIELAERYTNMTKILFLALWYCSIYPAALFMCSFALFINFFTDRFSLMRTWKRAPALGTRISRFSRRYFFSTAIVAMAIVSAYYWSGFPYDNLCEDGVLDDTTEYDGTWKFIPQGTSNIHTVSVEAGDIVYKYCFQDFIRMPGRSFPPLPKFQPEGGEWMTDEQEWVTVIYGWTGVAVLAIVLLVFVKGWWDSAMSYFYGTYKPSGQDQGINFSEVPTISTYIPQVTSSVYAYPLLACDVDEIDKELLDWTDPDRPFEYYDLTKDADEVLQGQDMSNKHVFSTVSHWPPPPPPKEDVVVPVKLNGDEPPVVKLSEAVNGDETVVANGDSQIASEI